MSTVLAALVVDDQAPFRAAGAVLRRFDGLERVGDVSTSGAEPIPLADNPDPALVVMTINTPR